VLKASCLHSGFMAELRRLLFGLMNLLGLL
jgi:hypothetical protein